jgi:hypothetical protein
MLKNHEASMLKVRDDIQGELCPVIQIAAPFQLDLDWKYYSLSNDNETYHIAMCKAVPPLIFPITHHHLY